MANFEKRERNYKKPSYNAREHAQVREGDEFILDIKRLGINGEGIGFYNKLAIFVEGAIPGEGHNVSVTKADGRMAFATTKEIKHASPLRKEPECPYQAECKGCPVMHIDYKGLMKYKKDIFTETLNRYTTINTKEFEIHDVIPAEQPLYYKNRAVYSIHKGEKTEAYLLNSKGYDVMQVEEGCMAENKLIKTIKNQVLVLIDRLGIQPFLYKFTRGVLRYMIIRVTRAGKAMVSFICYEKNSKLKELAEEVLKIEGVESVYESFNTNVKPGNYFGEEIHLLAGEKFITEKVGKYKFHIYPEVSFPLYTAQAEKLYDALVKSAKLSFKENVLCLNAGVGLAANFLAHNSQSVTGIDYNKNNVAYATENAEMNHLKNVKFLQGDTAELFSHLYKTEHYDVLVAAPTKNGMDEDLLKEICSSGIRRVLYLSSNPSTLAKNLEMLKDTYNVKSMTLVDTSPQTPSIDSLTVLELKKSLAPLEPASEEPEEAKEEVKEENELA